MIKSRFRFLWPNSLIAALSAVFLIDGVAAQPISHAPIAEDNNMVLEPIIITARRREEKIQDSPVSVSVIQQDQLVPGRVSNLEDAAFHAPNVNFNDQGGPLTIRGVGSLGISGGVDRSPAIGLFIDDVFVARPLGYPTLLDGLERVEIIRGSQSVLYGKNTFGGAVNLLSRLPGDKPGAELDITYASNHEKRVRTAFETPIKNTGLAMRVDASWSLNDGYIVNNYNHHHVSDVDYFTGRIVVAGEISDATRIKIIGDFSQDKSDGGLWYAPVDFALRHKADHDFTPENNVKSGGFSARIDHDFDAFELTSITAMRGHNFSQYLDGDFTPSPSIIQAQVEKQRQFSQEIRLTSKNNERLRWMGGLFYMHEKFEGTQFFDFAYLPRNLLSRDVFEQANDTYSAFGEVGYFIVPKLELSAGGRLTYDRKDTTSKISTPSGTYMFGNPGFAADDVSFTNFSPEISASWHFSPGNIAYAKISRGYKAGGISPYIEADGRANSYDPETTMSYEIGAKTTMLDGRLTLSAATFYIDWKNQQAVIYTTPFTRVYRNAAAATSKGFEIEGTFAINDEISLSGGYGYTDAKYDDFIDEILKQTYSGNPLPFAPKHSFNTSLNWQHELHNNWLIHAGVDYSYRSSYSFTANNEFRQKPTNIIDAHIGIEKDWWRAILWGKNLSDETYLKNYFNYAGTDMGVAALGRSFGFTLAAKW
ncbi:TonB-dependent receptor [Bartonella sp. HY406]|uniref:TonB-dependent receptor n=1 Tax=Bartonella sp. HY406 TaxID=2979331 RepID=UPI0021C7137D|nr:TonB-dependent receptor [Bartonella sp. HY406]UXN05078.1 TonB-dependent receptor [Bartonella sp. HY406]